MSISGFEHHLPLQVKLGGDRTVKSELQKILSLSLSVYEIHKGGRKNNLKALLLSQKSIESTLEMTTLISRQAFISRLSEESLEMRKLRHREDAK